MPSGAFSAVEAVVEILIDAGDKALDYADAVLAAQYGQMKPTLAWADGLRKLAAANAYLLNGVTFLPISSLAHSSKEGVQALANAGFAGWTMSASVVYIRDTPMASNELRLVLHHEAQHVAQFKASGGPPRTYEAMLAFEVSAYIASEKNFENYLEWRNGWDLSLEAVLSLADDAENPDILPKDKEQFIKGRMIKDGLLPPHDGSSPKVLYEP